MRGLEGRPGAGELWIQWGRFHSRSGTERWMPAHLFRKVVWETLGPASMGVAFLQSLVVWAGGTMEQSLSRQVLSTYSVPGTVPAPEAQCEQD